MVGGKGTRRRGLRNQKGALVDGELGADGAWTWSAPGREAEMEASSPGAVAVAAGWYITGR